MLDWRKIFSDEKNNSSAQNPQNEQNSSVRDSFAHSAYFAGNDLKNKTKEKYGDCTIQKLKEYLGDDWESCKDNPEVLEVCVNALVKEKLMKDGVAPFNYTSSMICVHCGIVPVPPEFADGKVALGCPWCFNRAKGLPIPEIDQ